MSNTNDFNYQSYQPDWSPGITPTPHENVDEQSTEQARAASQRFLLTPGIIPGAGEIGANLLRGNVLSAIQARHHSETGPRIALEDAYDRANDTIYTRTGRRLGNPVRERFGFEFDQNGVYFDPLAGDPTGGRYTDPRIDPVAAWHAQVAELQRSDQRLSGLDTSPGAMQTQAQEIFRRTAEEYERYMSPGSQAEQLMRGLLMMPGQVVGGVSSGDPLHIAQLPLFLTPAPAGEYVVSRLLAGAGLNVSFQGLLEQEAIDDAHRLGRDYPASQIALDFALASMVGAAAHVAHPLIAGERLPRVLPPDLISSRFIRDTETPLERMAAETEGRPPPPPPPASGPGSGVDLGNALEGRGERLVVAAQVRDAATVSTLPDTHDPLSTAQEIAHNDRFVRGEESAPYEPDPPRRAEEGRAEAAAREADPPAPGTREEIRLNGQVRPRTFMEFDPREVAADPQTFQYKEFVNEAGENDALAGVRTWDGQSAGTIAVFERADGTRVIADGHQRRALALRAQADGQQGVKLRGYLYRERDGWTARDVRDLSAQSNLRAGTGTVFDTANLLRDSPELLDSSIPRNRDQFRVAHGLVRLSEPAYRAVRAGVIDPKLGQIIGEVAVDHPELHEALVNLFKEHPPATLRDAAFIVREAMEAPRLREASAQLSMFGDAPELVAMQQRAVILRTAEKAIRDDARIFAAAERNADALEEAGNILAGDENARRAAIANALLRELDKLATRPGPVAQLLRQVADDAARDLMTPREAADRFVSQLRDLLDKTPLTELMHPSLPAVEPPPAKMPDPATRDEPQHRQAELADAAGDDDEAFQGALAEVALLRAQEGVEGVEMPPADAIGWAPERIMERVLDAADTLGIDDPTVHDVAMALLAKPDEDMIAEARERLAAGEALPGVEPEPYSFLEVTERGQPVKSPFNPFDMADLDALKKAAAAATLPELQKMQREFGFGSFEEKTREEFTRAMIAEWRDVHEAPAAEPPPAKGQPSRGNAGRQSTTQAVAAQLGKEFPKIVPHAVRNARLHIVQSVRDLPAGAKGQFARLMERARTVAARAFLRDDFERGTVRKYAAGPSDLFVWHNGDAVMAVEMENNPRGAVGVNFGKMTATGIDIMRRTGGDLRSALNTLAHAMAAIDQHAAETKSPVYMFSGASDKHEAIYSVLADYMEPPAGYSMHHLANYFALIRNEFLQQHDGVLWRALEDARRIAPDDLRAMSKERMGGEELRAAFNKLAQRARIGEELFSRNEGSILGFAAQGRAYIVADHVIPEDAAGVLYHELGAHVGLPEMLGPEGHAHFLSEVQRLRVAGDPDLNEAHKLAKAEPTLAGLADDDPRVLMETSAYALQYADWSNMNGGVRHLWRRLINSARAWLWRTWPSSRTWSHLTFADMQHLTLGAMRHVSRNEPRTLYDQVEGQYARGRDGGDWRGDKRFDAAGLTERQRAYAEMALNNFRNEDIAEEWGTEPQSVSVGLSQAHKTLVGQGHSGIPRQAYDTTNRSRWSTPDLFRLRNKYTWRQMETITGIKVETIQRRVAAWEKTHPEDALSYRREKHLLTPSEQTQLWTMWDEQPNKLRIANRLGRSWSTVAAAIKRGRPEWLGGEPINPADVMRDTADRADQVVNLLKDCE